MTSEVALTSEKEWLERKDRIGKAMGEFASLARKTIVSVLPDIREIKEKELWRHGDYESFNDFCLKALNVTRQHVYKLLSKDENVCKVLEINEGLSTYLTSGAIPEPQQEVAEQPIYEPPATKKPRKQKPQPDPVEVDPGQALSEPVSEIPEKCPHCGRVMP